MGFAALIEKAGTFSLSRFGEAVTFASAGDMFTSIGIFSVNEMPIIPMDGEKARPEYILSCASSEVTEVTPLYTVLIRAVEYRILAVTPNPVTGITDILLGHPS
jgi:hypothetical protein